MGEKIIDQKLKDAADNWVDSHYNKGVEYSKAKRGAANPKSGFIAGANWQKEQSATDAIEFAQPFKSTMPIYTVPSIPTDEEIEDKAHNDYTYGYLMPIGSYDRSRYEEKKESYTAGYKQALKDLGYADN